MADLVRTLVSEGSTVATAESLTGGGLGALLTSVPGSSAAYVGGVVSYATRIKVEVVGVPQEVVDRFGVISAECAEAMATGIRERLGTTYGLSTTGVAGPDTQDGEPAGTVFVGIAGPDQVHSVRFTLLGDRQSIREATCREAVSALAETLRGNNSSLR